METTATKLKCPICGKEAKQIYTLSINYNKVATYIGVGEHFSSNMCNDCANEITTLLDKFRTAERRTKYNELKAEFEKE